MAYPNDAPIIDVLEREISRCGEIFKSIDTVETKPEREYLMSITQLHQQNLKNKFKRLTGKEAK